MSAHARERAHSHAARARPAVAWGAPRHASGGAGAIAPTATPAPPPPLPLPLPTGHDWWQREAVRDKVLVVDGDVGFGCAVAEALARAGLPAAWTPSGDKALLALRRVRPAAVVVALDGPGGSGPRLVRALRRDPGTREVPLVVLSAHPSGDRASTPLRLRPLEAFVVRPASAAQVVGDVERLLAASGRGHIATSSAGAWAGRRCA